MTITENVRQLLNEVPDTVRIMAAAKTRQPDEILEAMEAGINIIGENYIQEAEAARREIEKPAEWHFIGHLQKNKAKKAVDLFDMIETVDSYELAAEINRRCIQAGKTMPVLIEINSGREPRKSGIYPEDAERLVTEIAALPHVRVTGLMTMGPLTGDPEDSRPYFRETRAIFEHLKRLDIPNVTMSQLSMGMTDSYRVALEEGATIIRIGSL
ncbi:MAG: YggS family pyridoxal phosphate-dependent enzyme, partial [Dehalococcoidales bacterium]|nr:YggS family pyridoxal phosphate-dependent enzyme [Dehalococcoidales bacterium]